MVLNTSPELGFGQRTKTKEIESYFDALFPICRSISGNGVRESFEILEDIIDCDIVEVPSGSKVLDWVVPKEWNLNTAYIIDPNGNKILDASVNNLHIMGYSIPFRGELTFEELEPHLHYLEKLPDAIPYCTSYYNPKWGFCLSKNQFDALPREGVYRVVVDTTLEDGSITYGEKIIQGESNKEIFFTSYLCHPSLANNELSGPLTLAFLYKKLREVDHLKFSYRFLLAPETIGSLCYLDTHGEKLKQDILAGFVLTCCGDRKDLGYKFSRGHNSVADKMATAMLQENYGPESTFYPFDPIGSDERQYCSPGYNLPVGSFVRSKYHEYKEYHNSLDDKSFISFEAIAENVDMLFDMIMKHEDEQYFERVDGRGEPNLGKRDLYADLNGKQTLPEKLTLRMRLLNFCDGENPISIFRKTYGYSKEWVNEEIQTLKSAELIRAI